MIKKVILDLDDTLIDTGKYYFRQIKIFAKELKKDLSLKYPIKVIWRKQEEIDIKSVTKYGFQVKRFPLSFVKTYRYYAGESGKKIKKSLENKYYNIGFKTFSYIPELLPGSKTILKYLQKRYELILYSLGDYEIQYNKVKQNGIDMYFSRIEIMKYKNVKTLKELAGKQDVKELVIIGDSLKNEIGPGMALGIKSIFFNRSNPWVYHNHPVKQGYITITKLMELKKYL